MLNTVNIEIITHFSLGTNNFYPISIAVMIAGGNQI